MLSRAIGGYPVRTRTPAKGTTSCRSRESDVARRVTGTARKDRLWTRRNEGKVESRGSSCAGGVSEVNRKWSDSVVAWGASTGQDGQNSARQRRRDVAGRRKCQADCRNERNLVQRPTEQQVTAEVL